MGTLFFNTATKQISYDTPDGPVTIFGRKSQEKVKEDIVSYPFECILGIIKIDLAIEYLFFCSVCELVGTWRDGEVYLISKINYVPLSVAENEEMADSIGTMIEDLNFYYTFQTVEDEFLWNGDMINNLKQHLETMNDEYESEDDDNGAVTDGIPYKFKSHREKKHNSRNPFSRRFVQSRPMASGIGPMIVANMFCGYFESRMVRSSGEAYILKILSQISIRKIGPRMISRGVDANGDVSFFVETRFVTKSSQKSVEFVILRGSVPLYWSQDDPLKPAKLSITEDLERTEDAFGKHMKKLEAKYGRIIVVDLLGQKKYESILLRQYAAMCQKHGVDYIHFDINRFSNSLDKIKAVFYNQLMDFMMDLTKTDGKRLAFAPLNRDFDIRAPSFIGFPEEAGNEEKNEWDDEEDLLPTGNNFKDLKITFRVNCMDCLDRTNIAQSLIFDFFDDFKFNISRSMWMNNGNALSKMYTGSDALKGELHAHGKRSMIGRVSDFVISANRMINNAFTDKDKQSVIDIILGKKSS